MSQTAADYLDPTREPEPSAETGPGTHFSNTFDPALREEAPRLPNSSTAPEKSAAEKLASTSSTMTTAQLQAAATEGDPNNLQKK